MDTSKHTCVKLHITRRLHTTITFNNMHIMITCGLLNLSYFIEAHGKRCSALNGECRKNCLSGEVVLTIGRGWCHHKNVVSVINICAFMKLYFVIV